MEFSASSEDTPSGASGDTCSYEALEEQKHFQMICRSMLSYGDYARIGIDRRQDHLNQLPSHIAKVLPTTTFSKIPDFYEAVEVNEEFFRAIVYYQEYGFRPRDKTKPLHFPLSKGHIPASQMHRNHSILTSLVREWSDEGLPERESCFKPLLDELCRVLPVTPENAFTQKVLVPGSGLSRLPVEVASLGYATQANEFSMYMLMASHFILNGLHEDHSYQIFPWLDRY